MDMKDIHPQFHDVEQVSGILEEAVNEMVDSICGDLDAYVRKIDKLLLDDTKPMNNRELEEACLNIPTLLYILSAEVEAVGLKEDVSNTLRKQMFHRVRKEVKGTVAEKESQAHIASQYEEMVNHAYSRTYRGIKSRIDYGWEILNSIKRVLSLRIAELGITMTDMN